MTKQKLWETMHSNDVDFFCEICNKTFYNSKCIIIKQFSDEQNHLTMDYDSYNYCEHELCKDCFLRNK